MGGIVNIIDEIDTAIGCQQCGRDLDHSPSTDFCTENCQTAWQAQRIGATPELTHRLPDMEFQRCDPGGWGPPDEVTFSAQHDLRSGQITIRARRGAEYAEAIVDAINHRIGPFEFSALLRDRANQPDTSLVEALRLALDWAARSPR
jgi:hypothetical protein